MTNRKARILLWDIETAYTIAKTWSLFKPMISPSQITQDWFIFCGAWKFLGENKIYVSSCTKKELLAQDDKKVVKKLCEAINKADIVIGHNGDKFDLKKLKARVIKHGLPALSHVKTIDTLKVAKKEFNFTSNALNYIGQFLGVGKKIATEPGLWDRVMDGDIKALKKMVDYNKQDVNLLEKVYLKMRPHISNHPPLSMITGNQEHDSCPACDSNNSIKYGFVFKMVNKYQRYKCNSCGNSFCGRKKLI